MALAALFIGLFIAALGLVGVAAPGVFLRSIGFFQTPPVIYLAAVFRVAVGIVLIRASAASRSPRALRVLGFLILIGGLLTPFIGLKGAETVMRWWSEGGSALVRLWAGIALAIGAFIVYAVDRRRRAV